MKNLRKALLASLALLTATGCTNGAASVGSSAKTAEATGTATPYAPPKESGYNKEKPGRIAYTADGNAHDQDDWAATPGSLSILAAVGLQDALVHYDYNDNTADHTGVFPMSFTQEMRDSVANAAYFFGYEAQDLVGETTDSIFYDDSLYEQNAIDHLAGEIEKSTEDDPLYIILGGPAEIVYEAMEKAQKGKDHIMVISHSQWNEWAEADGSWCKRGPKDGLHTLEQCGITLENGNLIRIQDQNAVTVGETKTPMLCITSDKTKEQQTQEDFDALYAPVQWMKNAKNPGLNYIYDRLVDMTREEDDTDKCDMSDAGMMLYLLDGLVENNYESLEKWYEKYDFLNTDARLDKSLSLDQLNSDVLKVAYQDAIEVKAGEEVKLPETVKVTLGDRETTADVAVQWDGNSEQFAEPGVYVCSGTLTLGEGMTNVKGRKAYQVVHVASAN